MGDGQNNEGRGIDGNRHRRRMANGLKAQRDTLPGRQRQPWQPASGATPLLHQQ